MLPLLSVHGAWASVKDVWLGSCGQFVGHFGDVSLQNISLLASMQPGSWQRSRVRWDVHRLMHVWLGPDQCVHCCLQFLSRRQLWKEDLLKIKVASVFDQAFGREVERVSSEILRKLRARLRAVEGEADFGVWRPFGQRAAKSEISFTSWTTQSWRCKEIPGPNPIVSWEACDLAAPTVLDRCASAFHARVERFQDNWRLCVSANTRCRAEHWEAEQRRQALFHDLNPELSACSPGPWNSVIRESSQDGDFWKRSWKTLQIIVTSADWTPGTNGTDPGHRRAPRSNEDVMGETTCRAGAMADIRPHQLEDKSVRVQSQLRWLCGCARRNEHVCEFCLEPHRTVECSREPGWKPPKVSLLGVSPAKVPSDHWTQVWGQ